MSRKTRLQNEQNRKEREQKSLRSISKLVLALVILVAGVVWWRLDFRNRQSRYREHIVRYTEIEKAYLGSKTNREVWWLPKAPVKEIAEPWIRDLVEQKRNEVKKVIQLYARVTPLTQEVARHFQDFTLSIFLGGRASMTIASSMEEVKGRPEICFIPHDKAQDPSVPFLLYWRTDWGLMMRAVEYPPVVFVGFLFHELGHGLRHPVAPNTVHYEFGSPKYLREEAEMHEMEFAVMNAASKGAFFREVSEILREHHVDSFKELLFNLSLSDLQRLDRSVGAEHSGRETGDMLLINFRLALGFAWIDERRSSFEEKVALYKWLHTGLPP